MTVAPYKVVTSSLDLENIDLSKSMSTRDATGGYDVQSKVITSADDLEEPQMPLLTQ